MGDGYDAVVLAGGDSRRMGADKAIVEVGGQRLLDRALNAVAGARTIVIVGPPRPDATHSITPGPVLSATAGGPRLVWTQENPAGSGPASALVHALSSVTMPNVVVLAVDVPFAAGAIARLLAALPDYDVAMLIDDAGRRQPLLAAYDTQALRDRAKAAGTAGWAGRSMRSLVEGLRVAEVPAIGAESLDCDTPEDLERAEMIVTEVTTWAG